jgi:hypothetical protein
LKRHGEFLEVKERLSAFDLDSETPALGIVSIPPGNGDGKKGLLTDVTSLRSAPNHEFGII